MATRIVSHFLVGSATNVSGDVGPPVIVSIPDSHLHAVGLTDPRHGTFGVTPVDARLRPPVEPHGAILDTPVAVYGIPTSSSATTAITGKSRSGSRAVAQARTPAAAGVGDVFDAPL